MSEQGEHQRDFWERRAAAWERRADEIGAFSDTYGVAAMDALAPQPGERVLDLGCGPGSTTIELGRRVGAEGAVVGVDISSAMIAAAERRSDRAAASNLSFVLADVQSDPLGGPFDAAFSRFGVMFFPDPRAAFNNIGAALRPGGRIGWAVWGPLQENPWMFLPTLAAAPVLGAELSLPGPGEPGPFSLSEPGHVTGLLEGAGFDDVRVDEVEGAREISEEHADEDVRMLFEVGPLGDAYTAAEEPVRREAVDAVIAALEPHRDGAGWRLAGKGYAVTARRPG
jgi:SAM-dependent methyltransferase